MTTVVEMDDGDGRGDGGGDDDLFLNLNNFEDNIK